MVEVKFSRLNLSPLEEELKIKLEKNTQNSNGQIYGFFSLNNGLLLNKSCFKIFSTSDSWFVDLPASLISRRKVY